MEESEITPRGVGINQTNQKTLNRLYPQLRTETEKWNAKRTQWMEAQFIRGQHPDTHPAFWQGFQETPPPSVDVTWFNEHEQSNRIFVVVLGMTMLIFLGVPILLTIWFIRRAPKAKTFTA